MSGRTVTRPSGQTFSTGLRDLAYSGLLPTPISGDWKGQLRSDGTATMLSGKVALMEKERLLPTPNSSLHKTSGLSEEAWEKRISDKRQEDLNMAIYRKTGSTSQLNPLFVAEMMGFPSNYTILPFLDGEKSPSKPMVTP